MASPEALTELPNWAAYPSGETSRTSVLDELEYFRARIERDSARLFSEQVNVDIYWAKRSKELDFSTFVLRDHENPFSNPTQSSVSNHRSSEMCNPSLAS